MISLHSATFHPKSRQNFFQNGTFPHQVNYFAKISKCEANALLILNLALLSSETQAHDLLFNVLWPYVLPLCPDASAKSKGKQFILINS